MRFGRTSDWRRIRDGVLPAFHRGVERQLDEIAGADRSGIREPVLAAIDITTFNFWPSPVKSENDVRPTDEPVRQGDNTPIVLGIDPVRDYGWWEPADREDVVTTSREEIVKRPVDQADQHVDLHKVFCDREFDSHGVRDVLDRHNMQYVVGKQKQSDADFQNIEGILEDDVCDSRVERACEWCDGRKHKVSIIYLPGGEYSLFTVNGWVDTDRAQALTAQGRKRWRIENEYESITANFLPQMATKDYRNRFLYFVVGVMMYNVWRLADFLLRGEVDVDLGESPPIPAGEIVELVGLCLFDPGG